MLKNKNVSLTNLRNVTFVVSIGEQIYFKVQKIGYPYILFKVLSNLIE